MRRINEFWSRLGICADDVVFTQESRPMCEFGDAIEFIAYGEERCKKLGTEDDEEVAGFLFQAFDGDVKLWYASLPINVQSSWYHLKHALLEEFGGGGVLESLHLLCQVWWQVPEFEKCFDVLWKIYERVSFFDADFVHTLKKLMMDGYREAYATLQTMYNKKDEDDALKGCMHMGIIDMEDGFKDIVTSHKDVKESFSSSWCDDLESMDDLSSDEGEGMHDMVHHKASSEGNVKQYVGFQAQFEEYMQEEHSFDDTKGVGKDKKTTHMDFAHGQVEDDLNHDVGDMHLEDTREELSNLDARDEDVWDISILDAQRSLMEMDACMVDPSCEMYDGDVDSKSGYSSGSEFDDGSFTSLDGDHEVIEDNMLIEVLFSERGASECKSIVSDSMPFMEDMDDLEERCTIGSIVGGFSHQHEIDAHSYDVEEWSIVRDDASNGAYDDMDEIDALLDGSCAADEESGICITREDIIELDALLDGPLEASVMETVQDIGDELTINTCPLVVMDRIMTYADKFMSDDAIFVSSWPLYLDGYDEQGISMPELLLMKMLSLKMHESCVLWPFDPGGFEFMYA